MNLLQVPISHFRAFGGFFSIWRFALRVNLLGQSDLDMLVVVFNVLYCCGLIFI